MNAIDEITITLSLLSWLGAALLTLASSALIYEMVAKWCVKNEISPSDLLYVFRRFKNAKFSGEGGSVLVKKVGVSWPV